MQTSPVLLNFILVSCLLSFGSSLAITGVSAGLAAISSFAITSYNAFRCRFTICCDEKWIPQNVEGLKNDLSKKLHGQHLVLKTVVGHIKGHLRNNNPSKALVLSFHGPTGVGKNFVSRIIADNLYKDGLHSKFVHLISATKEFPHEGMVPFYKDQLKGWIEGNVSMCERSMFIFDEVDKLPALLLDVVKPYLDHYEHLGGVNYRKAIFLFLSNSAGTEIAKTVLKHWHAGKKREDLQLSDIENEVTLAAMNDENQHGLWHSQLISHHLITAFIPFLPLEKEHVRKCIKDAMVNQKYVKDRSRIHDSFVNKVLQELSFFPKSEQLFSITGCKRVSEKLDYVFIEHEGPFEVSVRSKPEL